MSKDFPTKCVANDIILLNSHTLNVALSMFKLEDSYCDLFHPFIKKTLFIRKAIYAVCDLKQLKTSKGRNSRPPV